MPLVNPLSADHDIELQQLSSLMQSVLGFVPNSVLTMHRRPAIAKAFIGLNQAVMHNEGLLTDELKRLIALVSSAATGCQYCQAHTALAAEGFGKSRERVLAIWSFEQSPLFSEAEKVAFRYALAASSTPNAVDEALQAQLRLHWDEGDLVEMTAVIALFGFLNRWNDSMGTTLEPVTVTHASEALGAVGWQAGKHALAEEDKSER